MSLGTPILKILNKKYEADSFIERKFLRYDLGFRTDNEGNPIIVFVGKKDSSGKIKGRRYARRLVKNAEGETVRDHWDDKGPAA